jgi:hypothetical protein
MRFSKSSVAHVEWRLPEQRFEGTPEQVAADVDRLIATLIACRLSLRASGTVPAQGVADAAPAWRRILASAAGNVK